MKPDEAPLTDEQIALAWRQMHRPPTWPATLEEALQHPVRKKCIYGCARQLARAPFAHQAGPRHSLPAPPVPPTPTQAPTRRQDAQGLTRPRARLPKLEFDARAAAANDLFD
jgi:hypothetical protein